MDGYTRMVRERAERSPEFYRLRYEQALSYLAGEQPEDREIGLRILRDQLGIDDDEVRRIVDADNRATA